MTSDFRLSTEQPDRVGRFDRKYADGMVYVDIWDGRFWRRSEDFRLCPDQRRPWREVRE
jgi:hypothetical protein